jgi:hypothetical protein
MKLESKRMLTIAAMVVIFAAFLVMVATRNLLGDVACLFAMFVLLSATRSNRRNKGN